MRVIHEPDNGDGNRQVLATDVEKARRLSQKFWGLRFTRQVPEGYALVFEFEGSSPRTIDMLFVRTPIDVIWLIDERVNHVSTLRPWIGVGMHRADCVIELPPGTAGDVEASDRVFVEG